MFSRSKKKKKKKSVGAGRKRYCCDKHGSVLNLVFVVRDFSAKKKKNKIRCRKIPFIVIQKNCRFYFFDSFFNRYNIFTYYKSIYYLLGIFTVKSF